MKYEINLFPGKKRWEISLLRIWEDIRKFLTSPVFLFPVLAAVFLLTVFWTVIVPLHRIPPVHNAEIRNLELLLKNINEEKSALFKQSNTIIKLKEMGFRWEDKFVSLGRIELGPLWLVRMAFEEEKERGIPVRSKGEVATKQLIPRKILKIEGAARSKDGKPQVALIARLIDSINREPSFNAHFEGIELKGINASTEEPGIVNFQLAAILKEKALKQVEVIAPTK